MVNLTKGNSAIQKWGSCTFPCCRLQEASIFEKSTASRIRVPLSKQKIGHGRWICRNFEMMGISIYTHGIILPQMASRTGIIYNCDRAIETNHAIKETDIRRRGGGEEIRTVWQKALQM